MKLEGPKSVWLRSHVSSLHYLIAQKTKPTDTSTLPDLGMRLDNSEITDEDLQSPCMDGMGHHVRET
jgi:hypothetical protein